jgi:hypothetical protein
MSAALQAQAMKRRASYLAEAAECLGSAQVLRAMGHNAAADRMLTMHSVNRRHAARLATLAGSQQ